MRKAFIYFLVILIFTSCGCETVRKKFARKRKQPEKQEEMILVPQDYSREQLPADIAYMNYYNYWKSWHTELLQFLQEGSNVKKIRSCFEQIVLNLEHMKETLPEEKVKQLDNYISKVMLLQADFENNIVSTVSFDRLRSKSEMLLNDINRYFSYSRVKDSLAWK